MLANFHICDIVLVLRAVFNISHCRVLCFVPVLRHCRVLCFVPVLRGCVWYVWGYVRKKALLRCLCNYCEEGYGPV